MATARRCFQVCVNANTMRDMHAVEVVSATRDRLQHLPLLRNLGRPAATPACTSLRGVAQFGFWLPGAKKSGAPHAGARLSCKCRWRVARFAKSWPEAHGGLMRMMMRMMMMAMTTTMLHANAVSAFSLKMCVVACCRCGGAMVMHHDP